ncbi:BatA domain-containing protein [Candidatus Woesearchaeota archaeon]|nr:BatA domain-containing protein [Candidatus Woesearchaeota archaeon]
MNIFGQTFNIGNTFGYLSFLSFLFLLLLYFMRPKPFKKVIPSIIFLEKSQKKFSMKSFFKKFMKDWLILLHAALLFMLCLAILNVSAEVYTRKINKEIVFVIDVSASSQAYVNNRMLLDLYKSEIRKRVGVRNSIVLIKKSPEVLAKQTNPLNALKIVGGLKAADSLSNIWDAMMLAGDIASDDSSIIILSDFSDTNDKDLNIAKKLLEARGFQVEFVNLNKDSFSNVGIIRYVLSGNTGIVHVKNFDTSPKDIRISDSGQTLHLEPQEVQQISVELQEGINNIFIETKDDFRRDDELRIILPKSSETDMLLLTSGEDSYVRSALFSLRSVDIRTAKPPAVTISDKKLYVLDNLEYHKISGGTIEELRTKVKEGASLIVVAQDDMDPEKLGDLLPLEFYEPENQVVEIINTATINKLVDFSYGLSSKYYPAELRGNNTLVLAEINDKYKSPVITLTKYGNGNILYYGLIDQYNPFKISVQYPLFWINIIELLTMKDTYTNLNMKIGDIIYSDHITDPEGVKSRDYVVAEKTGIYRIDGKEVAVNLLNAGESDLNKGNKFTTTHESKEYKSERFKQNLNLMSMFILVALILSFFEIYILKKRGDL